VREEKSGIERELGRENMKEIETGNEKEERERERETGT